MTQKDYKRLAVALARSKTYANTVQEIAFWWKIFDSISNALAAGNARFDRRGFYEACRYAPK